MNRLIKICGLAVITIVDANLTEAQKPNIVFILADDLGWADLPVYGNKFNEAPNITKLASQGMRFTNAYAACPVCSPTRASIMSGQYPARVGVIDWIPGHWRPYEAVTVPLNRTQYLPEEIITIAEALKESGYATALYGKWHLGNKKEHHPLNQGFDEANVGQGYYNVRFDPPREESPDKIMSERLADFGIDFIERHHDKPFFLFLSHWDVHVQFDAEQSRIDNYLKKPKVAGYPCHAVYAAMIEQLDHSIGRVLQKIESSGLTKNTLVVFYSDNGGQISNDRYPGVEEEKMPLLVPSRNGLYGVDNPLRYIATSNMPLRGEKGNLYEGGIREPLIVSWPGRIKPGTVSRALVSSVDFYPTFLELAGVKKTFNQVLDGESLLPVLLKNEYNPERAIYWHYPVYHHGFPASAIRKGNWKLIENLANGMVELYNLETDISESTDLSKAFSEKTKEFYSLLNDWQKEVKAEFPKSNSWFDASRRFEWGRHPDARLFSSKISRIYENFDTLHPTHFITPLPNKNTDLRNGALWTRGSSGGKYPPMVYMPVNGIDLTFSFRYRHLGDGGWLWFFVDGDDGLGGTDHMLRVKLLRDGVQPEVDHHTLDKHHPRIDPVLKSRVDSLSGTIRWVEFFPVEKVDLGKNEWHEVTLIFNGEQVRITIDRQLWKKTLNRPGFSTAKRKLLWMQNGGEAGIELDDIIVQATGIKNEFRAE
jgi:uncharacterized sulfatase